MGGGELPHGAGVSFSRPVPAAVRLRRPGAGHVAAGQGSSMICACGTSASAGGRRPSASIAARIVPTWATTSAGWGPATTRSSAPRCAPPDRPATPRRGTRTRRSPPRTRRTAPARCVAARRPAVPPSRHDRTRRGRRARTPAPQSRLTRSPRSRQPAASAKSRPRRSPPPGPPPPVPAPATRPSSDSGGSRRPRISPPALSAVWPCRASSSGWVQAPGTVRPLASRRRAPPPPRARRTGG